MTEKFRICIASEVTRIQVWMYMHSRIYRSMFGGYGSPVLGPSVVV